jgi:hypothetical protein
VSDIASPCTSRVSAPGSDYESLDCELPLGHEGPHVAHDDGGYQRITITWEDIPQPEPTPEQIKAREEWAAKYGTIVPTEVGVASMVSTAVLDRLGAQTFRVPRYRGLDAQGQGG